MTDYARLNEGVIQQLDPPDVLYEEPQNSFVAQFIGENNTLDGTVKEIHDGLCEVELDDGTIIRATPVNISGVGSRTRVSIRPERVETNKTRMLSDSFLLKAEVLEVIYMGDVYRTRLNSSRK